MKVLFFSPLDEFNAFFRFNCFLYQFKRRYDCHITAALPPKAISVVSEADDFITVEDHFFDARCGNYPQVLDIMTDRNVTNFREFCLGKIDQSEYNDIFVYSVFNISTIDGVISNKYGFDEWFNEPDLGKTYFSRDIPWFKEWLKDDSRSLKPTSGSVDAMRKYNVDNSFIIVTRNFKNKQPETNTHISIPNLEEMIRYLTSTGIDIVNIGFPPSPLIVENDHYRVIADALSQDELMALFFLCKGVLLTGENAGYIVHSASEADIFLIKEEWGSMGLLGARRFFSRDITGEVRSKNYQELCNILSSHRPANGKLLCQPKRIVTLKE